mmetsp:Transcript_48926/g.111021  ORF Transcript_48926/g.111021 Transcript_48926/m.111021 type:complete len:198 (+) Transcript_48926:209-802(+)
MFLSQDTHTEFDELKRLRKADSTASWRFRAGAAAFLEPMASDSASATLQLEQVQQSLERKDRECEELQVRCRVLEVQNAQLLAELEQARLSSEASQFEQTQNDELASSFSTAGASSTKQGPSEQIDLPGTSVEHAADRAKIHQYETAISDQMDVIEKLTEEKHKAMVELMAAKKIIQQRDREIAMLALQVARRLHSK